MIVELYLIMSDPQKMKEGIIKNRTILLVILMMPVMGMAISIPLIMWKKPESAMVALPIIGFLIIQYSLLVLWISRKMKQLTAK